ncbi:MAG: hypothetical protein JO148_11080 [Acidimicrobiia bacterium]|nr:hypothetical protein [Acidimicrobiia bacterium]
MHICDQCGKKMATAGGLEIHMELHHKATPAADFRATSGDNSPLTHESRGEGAARVDVVPMERPRRQSSPFTAVPYIAVAIVALLVAGVASALVRRNANTPLAMVQAAATTTAEAKTAHVVTTIKADSGPLANGGINVDGGFDFDTRRAALEIDGSQVGAPELGKLQAIVDYDGGLVVYMKVPAEAVGDLGGKQWLQVDVGALMQKAGMDIDIGSLLQGQSNDPTQGLAMVRGADDVVKIGTDNIRGVPTTHYQLDVNIDKAIADAPTPEARDAMQKLSNLYTVRKVPVDLWLDDQGRVRRFQESLNSSVIRLPNALLTQGDPFAGHVTLTYDLYDFGRPVDVTLPPSSQVANLNPLLQNCGCPGQ